MLAKAEEGEGSFSSAEVVNIIRQHRHSLLNHLQVVSGWLQLKKPERAEEYVMKIRRKLEVESRVLEIKVPRLAALFLARNAWADSSGIEIEYDLRTDLTALAPPIPLWVKVVDLGLELFIEAATRYPESSPLLVTVEEQGEYYLVSIRGRGAGVAPEVIGQVAASSRGRKELDWDEAGRRAARHGGFVRLDASDGQGALLIGLPLCRTAGKAKETACL